MQAVTAALPFLESHDPATGEVISRFEATPLGEIPGRIERAHTAQRAWAALPLAQRCAAMARLKSVLFDRRQEIAEIVTREVGKPRMESLLADAMLAIDTAGHYSKVSRVARMLRSERVAHHNLAFKSKRGEIRYEPFGVIGIISPWNYPMAAPMGQMIPALVAGNAVLLKPSELTPWCGALLGELFAQANFPQDVVQVIQGRGDAGAALIQASRGADTSAGSRISKIDKMIFTGSVATGRKVAEACARQLIPSVLELGGKDAMIVLGDADLEIASSAAVWGSFTNCGQACLSVERIYVERSVAQKFTEMCLAKTRKLSLGPGLDPDVEVGPMINEQQVARVEGQLADAVRRGAHVLHGGKRAAAGSCFFEPTVITNVNASMQIMQEETFGPVLAICAVGSVDEAVRLANDSPFGLAASVWTRNTRLGEQIAARLHAGTVQVNDALSAFGSCEAPHGGRGASGWGRTHSRLGLLEMVQVKYVDVERLARFAKPWWFGYNEEVAAATDRFIEFLFLPKLGDRLRKTREALGVVFRKHRI